MRFYARRIGKKLYAVWDSEHNCFGSRFHVFPTRRLAALAAHNANRL